MCHESDKTTMLVTDGDEGHLSVEDAEDVSTLTLNLVRCELGLSVEHTEGTEKSLNICIDIKFPTHLCIS